jgi:hypothetical protein
MRQFFAAIRCALILPPVFNPLRADQMILAVGNVLRLAADVRGPLDEYQRSQLLSGLSITRNLAAEQAASAELLAWLRGEVDAALETDARPAARRTRERLTAAADGIEIGDVLGELLEDLRREAADDPLRRRVQQLLGEMADREVGALASGTR